MFGTHNETHCKTSVWRGASLQQRCTSEAVKDIHAHKCFLMQMSHQPITWPRLNLGRPGRDDPLKFKLSIRMRKNDDLRNFKCVIVDGARHAGLSVSETALLLGFSHKNISAV